MYDGWVKHCKQIARFINWSGVQKLMDIRFSLEGTVKTWFENCEMSVTFCNVFEDKLCEAFSGEQCS